MLNYPLLIEDCVNANDGIFAIDSLLSLRDDVNIDNSLLIPKLLIFERDVNLTIKCSIDTVSGTLVLVAD
jgi:hypothetical protein